jgi:3-deoxy-D-manno-octulosonate 8-phosphate phosphatase (KDO 8-P phosphatase)
MISKKLEHIKLLLLDVDGVLTDGRIIYNDQGQETKEFNARDGLGIKLLMKARTATPLPQPGYYGYLRWDCGQVRAAARYSKALRSGSRSYGLCRR